MTVTEAAANLGVTPQRIRLLISQERIKAVKRGRDWLIHLNEIEHYRQIGPLPGGRPKGNGK